MGQYRRTKNLVALFAFIAVLEVAGVRASVYDAIFPFFQWMQASFWFGVLGTTYGELYATVEAVHLLSMAVLCGSVVVADVTLLGLLFKDVPSESIVNGTYKCFKIAWAVVILTGIFCGAGVAEKSMRRMLSGSRC